jgi:ferric enterobactin receptor
VDWSLNYIKKFKKDGQELNVLYSSSFGKPRNSYNQIQSLASEQIPYAGTSGNTPGNDKQTNISIDYAHPIKKDFVIETGVKTVLQDISSVADIQGFQTVAKHLYPRPYSILRIGIQYENLRRVPVRDIPTFSFPERQSRCPLRAYRC